MAEEGGGQENDKDTAMNAGAGMQKGHMHTSPSLSFLSRCPLPSVSTLRLLLDRTPLLYLQSPQAP